MKKIKILLLCIVVGAMICACGKEETQEQQTTEITQEQVEEETNVISVEEPAETISEEEILTEDAELPEEEEIAEDAAKEAEVPTPEPVVFEEITTELMTYPILKYTIAGEQRQLDYTMYESMYPYDRVSNLEFAIGYSTGDVTGDGLEELIVSIYVVGNTLSELMQDTYVYTIDADINDLNEILYIPAMSGEQYAPGYKYNVGAFATGHGTLNLDLWSEPATPEEMPMMTSVELMYQDGMWSVNNSVAP